MFRRRSIRRNDNAAGTQVTILEMLPSNNGPNKVRTTVLSSQNPTNGKTMCCEPYEMNTIPAITTDFI